MNGDFEAYNEKELGQLVDFFNENILGKSLNSIITEVTARVMAGGSIKLFKKEIAEGHDLTEVLLRAIFMGVLLAEMGKTALIKQEAVKQ